MAKVKTKTKVRPLQDRLLIRRVEEEKEKTSGGIILPDSAKEKPQMGEVIAIGPGRITDNGERQKVDVKEGDRILFAKYAGTEVKVDDEDLLIMREDDILAVVK